MAEKDEFHIEESILSRSEFKNFQTTKATQDFLIRFLSKTSIAEGPFEIMKEFTTLDAKVRRMAQAIKSFGNEGPNFIEKVQSMSKHKDKIDGPTAVNLFGIANTRNWIVSQQLHLMLKGSLPPSNKGKVDPKNAPAQILKYALRAEQASGGEGSKNGDRAYLAGLLFDVLYILVEEIPDKKKPIQDLIKETFDQGIKTSKSAIAIARISSKLEFADYLVVSALLHDIGKIVLAITEPKFFPFYNACEKRKFSPSLRHFIEFETFGITHAALSALILRHSQWFETASKAVLFHHNPSRLKQLDKNSFDLASIIGIASNIADRFVKPKSQDDHIIKEWISPEYSEFPLGHDILFSAILPLFPQ